MQFFTSFSQRILCNCASMPSFKMPSFNSQQQPMERDVWYACYGSDMWRSRFLCYIKGGQVEGMKKSSSGSRDKSSPKETSWKTVPHRLFFGRERTQTWGPGGVAFLDPRSNSQDKTYMRLYKITLEQFNDLLLQMNCPYLFDPNALDSIPSEGSFFVEVFKKGWYRNVVYLGKKDDIPILCLTCPLSAIEEFKSGKIRSVKPSEEYEDTLVKGLVEGGQLSEKKARAYIQEAIAKPLC